MDAFLDIQQQGEHCRVRLTGELTIYSVASLKGELLELLENARHLEVNLGAVEAMDAAGLQLLYLLQREARRGDCTLVLSHHSSATRQVLELLDLTAHFGETAALSA